MAQLIALRKFSIDILEPDRTAVLATRRGLERTAGPFQQMHRAIERRAQEPAARFRPGISQAQHLLGFFLRRTRGRERKSLKLRGDVLEFIRRHELLRLSKILLRQVALSDDGAKFLFVLLAEPSIRQYRRQLGQRREVEQRIDRLLDL